MMASEKQHRGPGKGILHAGQRVITLLIGIVETRLRLAVTELEEEKTRLIRLLLLTGLTLLFSAFALASLIILLICAVDSEYRLYAASCITALLFAGAIIFGFCTLYGSRKSTLLKATRKELKNDREYLEDN